MIVLRRSRHHAAVTRAGPLVFNLARRGDLASAAAGSQLVREHFDFIWRLLRRLGLSQADADDATQQVFMIAMQKPEPPMPGKERSFLYGTALRVAANLRRAVQRRRETSHDDLDARVASSPGPEQDVEFARARLFLDELLEHLPDELRVVLVLAEIEQLAVREIAELETHPAGHGGLSAQASTRSISRPARASRASQSARQGGPVTDRDPPDELSELSERLFAIARAERPSDAARHEADLASTRRNAEPGAPSGAIPLLFSGARSDAPRRTLPFVAPRRRFAAARRSWRGLPLVRAAVALAAAAWLMLGQAPGSVRRQLSRVVPEKFDPPAPMRAPAATTAFEPADRSSNAPASGSGTAPALRGGAS